MSIPYPCSLAGLVVMATKQGTAVSLTAAVILMMALDRLSAVNVTCNALTKAALGNASELSLVEHMLLPLTGMLTHAVTSYDERFCCASTREQKSKAHSRHWKHRMVTTVLLAWHAC